MSRTGLFKICRVPEILSQTVRACLVISSAEARSFTNSTGIAYLFLIIAVNIERIIYPLLRI
jgi:hypothetical protein